MTKTLTEQWREGTLRGCFYWKLPNGNICTAYTDTMRDIKNVRDSDEVEVLQETPSYVEHMQLVSKTEQLEKKLKIAKKALKKYAESDNWFEEDTHGEVWSFQKESKYPWRIGFKALKEMEGVK